MVLRISQMQKCTLHQSCLTITKPLPSCVIHLFSFNSYISIVKEQLNGGKSLEMLIFFHTLFCFFHTLPDLEMM